MGLVRISGFNGSNNQLYENLINEAMFRTRCCIPCVIQSYNKSRNTVECQPAIREKIINEDGSVQYINLPLLINVPVVFPSSGSFSFKFPINRGDECLVVFSDLAIDNFWVNGGVQNPVEVRRHDLSDGIAIPGIMSQRTQEQKIKVYVEQDDIFVEGEYGKFSGKQVYEMINAHYHIDSGGGQTTTPLGVDPVE